MKKLIAVLAILLLFTSAIPRERRGPSGRLKQISGLSMSDVPLDSLQMSLDHLNLILNNR